MGTTNPDGLSVLHVASALAQKKKTKSRRITFVAILFDFPAPFIPYARHPHANETSPSRRFVCFWQVSFPDVFYKTWRWNRWWVLFQKHPAVKSNREPMMTNNNWGTWYHYSPEVNKCDRHINMGLCHMWDPVSPNNEPTQRILETKLFYCDLYSCVEILK